MIEDESQNVIENIKKQIKSAEEMKLFEDAIQ